jgi:GxxExxY protein
MSADKAQMGTDDLEMILHANLPGEYPLSNLTEKIIGAAFEVHRELGPGFLEKVYETALLRELSSLGLNAVGQAPIPVKYKGEPVGIYYADILIEGLVLVELKAADGLLPVHEAQVLHYLKATAITVGLLLNFGTPRVQVKRLVRSR